MGMNYSQDVENWVEYVLGEELYLNESAYCLKLTIIWANDKLLFYCSLSDLKK
jgi:hypothetical protein